MKAVATEVILTVGVLVAAGFTLLQLRGVFFAQQELSKEEVVEAFAKDLDSIIDKAIATTGDAAFVYYPAIKQYRVEIKDNVISILDKISGKTSTFSKLMPKIADNSFEDCEKIFVVKVEEKIAVYCKCLDLGEDCSDSLLCCSGYCNLSSKKCEELPICPKDRICSGAPEASKDSLGRDCCPSDKPVCSSQHCCPTDKPKWCETPITNNPNDRRCMDEDEYKSNCKKPSFVLLILQMNSQVPNLDLLSEECKDTWITLSPLQKCPDAVEVISVRDKVCYVADECNAFNDLIQCAISWGYMNEYTRIIGVKHGSSVCRNRIRGYTLKNGEVVVTIDQNIGEVCSHELGHTFGLCDEGYGNSICTQCDSGLCNVGGMGCSGIGHCCPNKPEQNSIMCSYDACGRGCSYGTRFASTSYAHLEKELNKYCG